MSLRETLRKAAGLLVELPPEPETNDTKPDAPIPGGAIGATNADAMWEQLEREVSGKTPSRGGSTPSAAPQATKTVAQIVQQAPGPNLDQIKINPLTPGNTPEGTLNFSELYRSANLPVVPYTAEQVLEMFSSLPAELPLESRRQMVQVAMNSMGKAIGASPETILADASRKLAALAAYADHLSELTDQYCDTAEKKIAQLEAEIAKTRTDMEIAKTRMKQETDQCKAESDRLDDVLEFFSLDVAPSKYAPETKA